MKKDMNEDTGLYIRFFNESDAAMALINREGLFLIYNRKFEALFEKFNQHFFSGENIWFEYRGMKFCMASDFANDMIRMQPYTPERWETQSIRKGKVQ